MLRKIDLVNSGASREELVVFENQQRKEDTYQQRKEDPYQHPPFLPYKLSALDKNTINMTSIQKPSIHYNCHSMYGFSEAVVTRRVMEKVKGERPFVLSRSTFASHGNHSAHWLGDNWSSFEYLANSIPGILNMNLFGVPLVGADICGFNGNSFAELCTRFQTFFTLPNLSSLHLS